MNKEETTELLNEIKKDGKKRKLLLHVCCAPCTCGVYDQLEPYFDITLFYYNPNTYPYKEYKKREEMLRILNNNLKFDAIYMDYNSEEFYNVIKGLEKEKEGGKRCEICYRLRLEATIKYAKKHGFDFFTSTLSVSPYKSAQKLNNIGEILENIYNIKYLYSDFKKRDGYKNSIKRSKDLGLYRQEYCGCEYSIKEKKEDETCEKEC